VRNPVTRWLSEEAFARNVSLAGNWLGTAPVSPPDLLAMYGRGRNAVKWTEQLLHKQPQSWFVWAADGRPQCDCVVAFEKLGTFAGQTVLRKRPQRPGRQPYSRETPLHPALELLYALDFQLWAAAKQEASLCYRPRPLPLPPSSQWPTGRAGQVIHTTHKDKELIREVERQTRLRKEEGSAAKNAKVPVAAAKKKSGEDEAAAKRRAAAFTKFRELFTRSRRMPVRGQGGH
jgi:hypothetical protein